MDEKFNFRGVVTDTQEFYMLAVLNNKDHGEDFKNLGDFGNLKLDANSPDKYFFLCQNEYVDDKTNKNFQRLYWSSDPDDFQENMSSGFKNQGVVRVKTFTNGGSIFLKYRTTLDGQKINSKVGKLRNFSNNMNSLSEDDQAFPVKFTPKYNRNLNISSIYYSLPYELSDSNFLRFQTASTEYNDINWVFRKITSTGSLIGGITTQKPNNAANKDGIFTFVDITSMDQESGSKSSNFNYGSVFYDNSNAVTAAAFDASSTSIKLHTVSPTVLSEFPSTNGIFKINEGTAVTDDATVVKYFKLIKNGDQVEFILKDTGYTTGLTGNFATIPDDVTVTIVLNKRNHQDCFTTLPKTAEFSKYFDIYLIPAEEYAYFPGGYQIKNTNKFPTSCHSSIYQGNSALTPIPGTNVLKFYSNVSREPYNNTEDTAMQNNPNYFITCTDTEVNSINQDKFTKYKKIYNLLLFSTIGSLQTNVWTSTGMKSYPSIAEHEGLDTTGANALTFYAWNNHNDAYSAYMYDYCDLDSVCGRCFGKNNKGESECNADFLTRKNAATTSSKNVKDPLTSGRYTGSHSEHQMPVWQIAAISAGSFVSVLLVGYLFHHFKKREEERK